MHYLFKRLSENNTKAQKRENKVAKEGALLLGSRLGRGRPDEKWEQELGGEQREAHQVLKHFSACS